MTGSVLSPAGLPGPPEEAAARAGSQEGAARAGSPPPARSHRTLWRLALAALLLAGGVVLLHFGMPGLAPQARWALVVFGAALIAWTVLDLDETPVALVAALALLAAGAVDVQRFYDGLGDDFIWLLVGAFLIAAVLQQSGLAERWALRVAATARTPAALLRRLTWFIVATALLVPSTSGRAALLLPVFVVLVRALDDPRLTRALALLFPSVILLSACISMLGAGAHLVALDFMQRLGGPVPGFAGWFVLAAPFGVLSSLLACELVLRLFVPCELRTRTLALPAVPRERWTPAQRAIVAITGLTLLAWVSGGWHGIEPALVALAGALAATCKPLTGIDLKTAVKKVEWNLVLFMAATMTLGEALLASGAASALASRLVEALALEGLWPPFVLAAAALVALLAHLVVTSRTARAAVLIPTLALPLAAAGANPVLLVFVVTMGSGFCQTLRVSAKPVTLFASGERAPFSDRELLRLALALLPGLWLLLTVFAVLVWPRLGLG